jgi:hypothetical protein
MLCQDCETLLNVSLDESGHELAIVLAMDGHLLEFEEPLVNFIYSSKIESKFLF